MRSFWLMVAGIFFLTSAANGKNLHQYWRGQQQHWDCTYITNPTRSEACRACELRGEEYDDGGFCVSAPSGRGRTDRDESLRERLERERERALERIRQEQTRQEQVIRERERARQEQLVRQREQARQDQIERQREQVRRDEAITEEITESERQSQDSTVPDPLLEAMRVLRQREIEESNCSQSPTARVEAVNASNGIHYEKVIINNPCPFGVRFKFVVTYQTTATSEQGFTACAPGRNNNYPARFTSDVSLQRIMVTEEWKKCE